MPLARVVRLPAAQMASPRPIPILLNPLAGHAQRAGTSVLATLEQVGVSARLHPVAPPELRDALMAELRAGSRAIGVAGGDGTLSAAAAVLAGTDAVLAPIPLGTLNHFARRLGLTDVESAARALAAGRTTRVPVGSVDDRRFINNASCGVYPRLVRHRDALRRWLGKWPAAAVAMVGVLARLRTLHVRLELPEATLERTVAGLWIGLGRGSFRLPIDEQDRREARVLEVVLPHADSGRGLVGLGVRVLWRLWHDETPRTRGLEIVRAPAVMLDAGRPIDVALDGEPLRLRPPLHFRILPDALAVICNDEPG